MAFQPHRYSRTRDLFDEFAAVLSDVDLLLLTEVYAAGEAPIAGAESKDLARAIRARRRIEPVVVNAVASARKAKPGPQAEQKPDDTGTAKPVAIRAGTKQAQIIAMLQRPEGATVVEMVEATGWLAHYADARIMPM